MIAKPGTGSVAVRVVVIVVAAAWVMALTGCDRTPTRDTPEGTIAAARYVLERGEARRLARFIYAEDEDQRRLWARLGVLLGNMERLAQSVQTRFPEELAGLKARAEEAAKRGEVSGLLSQITQQASGRGRRPRMNAAQREQTRDTFSLAVGQLLADPYGWLREGEGRLTTTFLTDESVALLWDGKPILPPLGLVMKRDVDGLWYFVLPTSSPILNQFMPRTREEYQIWGGLIAVFDQTVVDLRADIEEGHVKTLEELSRRAGEKLFVPAAMTFFAYQQLRDAQRREAQKAATTPSTP